MSLDRTRKNPLEHPDTPEVDPKQFWNFVIEKLQDDVNEFRRLQDRMGEHEEELAESIAYLEYAQESKEK